MTSEDFIKKIQNQLSEELPFVAYRKPNDSFVNAIIQNDDTLHVLTDYDVSGFVFAPFDNQSDSIVIPFKEENVLTCPTEFFEDLHDEASNSEESQTENLDDIKKKQHIELIKKGKSAIDDSLLKKVVISRMEIVRIRETNPLALFYKLLNKYPTAFVYCWFHPKIGLWLGATPEILALMKGNQFSTMALAGTQKYLGSVNVEWDEKEKEEQQIVTDFIEDRIKELVQHMSLSKAQTVKAGNILHLQTKISASIDKTQHTIGELVSTLHPTPAICGIPQNSAKKFIQENELYDREFYTGYLGELNIKQKTERNTRRKNVENNAYATIKMTSSLYVNLRCMQIKESNAIIYVGGGITQQSDPESEWEETVNKSMVMKNIF